MKFRVEVKDPYEREISVVEISGGLRVHVLLRSNPVTSCRYRAKVMYGLTCLSDVQSYSLTPEDAVKSALGLAKSDMRRDLKELETKAKDLRDSLQYLEGVDPCLPSTLLP